MCQYDKTKKTVCIDNSNASFIVSHSNLVIRKYIRYINIACFIHSFNDRIYHY